MVIVGFDGTEDGLKAIEEGRMTATIAQKPEEMGRLALQAAFDHFQGKTVAEQIDSPLELVKKIGKRSMQFLLSTSKAPLWLTI